MWHYLLQQSPIFEILMWRAFRIYGWFFWHSFFHKIRLGRTMYSKSSHSVQDCHKKPYYLNEDTLLESTNLYTKRSKKIQNTD